MIVLCHIRELCQQIADVYQKICKFSDIKVVNHATDGVTEGAQIVVMTIGGLQRCLTGRKVTLDLSALRVAVIDEVDFFFSAQDTQKQLLDLNNKYLSKIPKLQWLLFSATYPDSIQEALDSFCGEAYQIKLGTKDKLHLDHID